MDELLLEFRGGTKLAPYAVFSAGRSRTMWLSAFLSYGICACNFEVLAKVNSLTQVMELLALPGFGAAETLSAPAWPLLLTAAPNMKVVVVRRPLDEIMNSLEREAQGKLELDLPVLRRLLAYVQRALDKLSCQPQALTVDFHDLAREETCKAVFEHCLPYKHDSGWWKFMDAKVLNPDVVQLAQLYALRKDAIAGVARESRHMLFRLGRQGYLEHLKTGSIH